MKICVGIDPSINSSGVSLLFFNDKNELQKELFFLVRGTDHLTKREKDAAEKYADCFEYISYGKYDISMAEDNHEAEYQKTLNMIAIVDHIWDVVSEYVHGDDLVYIVQEGVSYGSSIRTKSIFDLAGLNYLLRMKFIKSLCNNMNFTIATPSEIKKFTTGNGNCKKDQMIELFKALHPGFDLPKLDDIADSYWMANFAKKIMIGC